MLSFAAFTPHPPIIIPEIGQDNTKYATATINSMEKLSRKIAEHDIDTIVFISPHTSLDPDHMTISYAKEASGDFAQFDCPKLSFSFEVDLDLADDIIKLAKADKLPIKLQNFRDDFSVDHGVLVPYYYLKKHLDMAVKIIIVGFSALPRLNHLQFGQVIDKAIAKNPQNIAVVASGDLSHRILEPGAEFIGQNFDKKIVAALQENKTDQIINIDEYLQEDAGECGYRSLLIMLGLLQEHQIKPQVLSYEAPFGVGYMVADFNLKV